MSEVRVTSCDGCATMVFDNVARRNALDRALLEAMAGEAARLAADASVKVVVVRGAGDRAFCSGADLDAMCEPPVEESVARMEDLLQRALAALASIEVPVVAVIQGACIGGGVQLALAADVRIASDDARFAVPAAQAGLPYPFDALRKLVALMGEGNAKAFMLCAQRLDAATALRVGLIEAVSPAHDLEADVLAWVEALRKLPRASAVAYKRMLSALAAGNVETALAAHAALKTQGLYIESLKQMAGRKTSARDGRST